MTLSKTRGYLVHLYTMSTLAFVILGIQWTLEGRYAAALIAMAVTLVIDATDGALARKYHIAHTAPGIDGALLDNVVDFTSYVFLPLLFMMHAGMLAQPMTLFAAVVAFSSAFGFSRTSAKQVDEGFFVGFPSYWNVVALYAFLLDLPAGATTALVLVLSLLVFVDVRFLYVSRLRRHRLLHLALGGAWGVACLLALLLEPGGLRTALIYGSLGYVAFYTAHSLLADLGARRRAVDPGRPRGA
jgi:phosphatidylcholine synthase